jgi:hypothetical protein
VAVAGQANPTEVQRRPGRGGPGFYRKTLGGENVGKIFVREGYEGKEQLIFDATTYKPKVNTTVTALPVAASPSSSNFALTSIP